MGFKSCPRVGGIGRVGGFNGAGVFVSSRAPVWGASWNRRLPPRPRKGFKSCPRVGGIFRVNISVTPIIRFQVVPPCGGHQSMSEPWTPEELFQVVPPQGGHP